MISDTPPDDTILACMVCWAPVNALVNACNVMALACLQSIPLDPMLRRVDQISSNCLWLAYPSLVQACLVPQFSSENPPFFTFFSLCSPGVGPSLLMALNFVPVPS